MDDGMTAFNQEDLPEDLCCTRCRRRGGRIILTKLGRGGRIERAYCEDCVTQSIRDRDDGTRALVVTIKR